MPNELNIAWDRCFWGITITVKRIHLEKMRLPFDGVKAYLRISSFGDSLELAFFGA